MDIAVTLAAIAKKALAVLLGDKKGRKFILYTIGIALFIVCIPLITLLGMFGWMAGNSGSIMDQQDILANIPNDQLVQIQTMDEVCKTIGTTFTEAGLEEGDCKKAEAIYIGYLTGMENQEGFYTNLANCFLNTTEESGVYDLVSETFLVSISEEDKASFDELYGVTPVRAPAETESQ